MTTATAAKTRRPALTIVRPSAREFLSAIIYGDPGIGKTVFLGTAQDDPRTAPMLLIDLEGGSSSLRGLDIDVLPINVLENGEYNWDEFDAALDYLASGDHPYRSVAIDSISEFHRLYLLYLLKVRNPGTRKIEDVSDQQEYGQALIAVNRVMREYRNLPMHTFFTSHAKDRRDPKEGTIRKLGMAGQASDQVPGIVDVTAYLTLMQHPETQEAVRVLMLRNASNARTKVRTAWMDTNTPDGILEPTMTKLLDALGF